MANRLTTRATVRNNTVVGGRWSDDVERLGLAIERFTYDSQVMNPCQISFFEIAGDAELHVNVTHRAQTRPVPGWSGPAAVADGFVLNRRFAHPRGMLNQIRDVVFARRA